MRAPRLYAGLVALPLLHAASGTVVAQTTPPKPEAACEALADKAADALGANKYDDAAGFHDQEAACWRRIGDKESAAAATANAGLMRSAKSGSIFGLKK